MKDLIGKTIFWRKDQVDILDRLTGPDDFKQSSMFKYLYCPCAWISKDGRGVIYGFYEQSERFEISWNPKEKRQLPDEFQLALLLLGVS